MLVSLRTINQSLQVEIDFISFIDYLCDKVEIFPVRERERMDNKSGCLKAS